MLVDAAEADEQGNRRLLAAGSEVEGSDADFQVSLGHAEVIAEPQDAPGAAEEPAAEESAVQPSEEPGEAS